MPPQTFWRNNIGGISSFILTVLAIATFFVTYDRKIEGNSTALVNSQKEHDLEIKARAAEQIKDSSAKATADLIVHERLKAVEDTTKSIAPQLSRMDEKLNWITDEIKEQKAARQAAQIPAPVRPN